MTHFLFPVLILISWTLIIWCVMYVRRLPAMKAAQIAPQAANNPDGDWKGRLPERTQWAAHNYNHLMEQPTIFYALMLTIFVTNLASPVLLIGAWAYVLLRILHSLVQITVNTVVVRFAAFTLSTLILIFMALSTVARLL